MAKQNNKKKRGSNLVLILIFIIGLSLLLYPSFADYWNSFTQSKAIASYNEQIASIDDETYQQIWSDATAYNASLLGRANQYLLSDEQQAQYEALLDISGIGVMGYIEIPSINVSLPIYHGTSEGVLQVAVGHLEWTSLPVGGESSHCVLSGHRGLPSARLFTDLDKMQVGDYFMLHILDETLTYEVDQIRIVDPNDTSELQIVEGKDYVTLVTCTPYGINTHRLLVRGIRVENLEEEATVRVTSDAVIIDKLLVAPFVLAPILLVLLIAMLISSRKKK